jgi:hypothetical protein
MLAAAFDRLGTMCFTVGIGTPVAARLIDPSKAYDTISFTRAVAVWLTVGVLIHIMAHLILGALDD